MHKGRLSNNRLITIDYFVDSFLVKYVVFLIFILKFPMTTIIEIGLCEFKHINGHMSQFHIRMN
jgi:hypothetical protein